MTEQTALLDAHEVAERIGVHVITVRDWVAKGEFPRPVHSPSGRKRHRWTAQQIAPWVEVYAQLRELEVRRLALMATARQARAA